MFQVSHVDQCGNFIMNSIPEINKDSLGTFTNRWMDFIGRLLENF
jgi:hypothetical protein